VTAAHQPQAWNRFDGLDEYFHGSSAAHPQILTELSREKLGLPGRARFVQRLDYRLLDRAPADGSYEGAVRVQKETGTGTLRCRTADLYDRRERAATAARENLQDCLGDLAHGRSRVSHPATRSHCSAASAQGTCRGDFNRWTR
jgi:hypothetical protein